MPGIFESITEFIGWLRIVASMLFVGIVVGAIVYFPNPSVTTFVSGIIIAVLGLFLGIMWATKALKGKGTIQVISNTMSTPELDKPLKEDKA